MKRVLALLFVLLSFAPLAHADDASKRAKAESLIDVMHMDRTMNQVMGMMKSQILQNAKNMPLNQQLNAKQQAIAQEMMAKEMDLVTAELSPAKLRPIMVDAYMKTFTEPELDAMYTFYSSPTGQSILAKMPQIMQNTMAEMQGLMQDVSAKSIALSEEYKKRLADAGSTPGDNTPAPPYLPPQ